MRLTMRPIWACVAVPFVTFGMTHLFVAELPCALLGHVRRRFAGDLRERHFAIIFFYHIRRLSLVCFKCSMHEFLEVIQGTALNPPHSGISQSTCGLSVVTS